MEVQAVPSFTVSMAGILSVIVQAKEAEASNVHSNAVFEMHESCDRCSSLEILTGFSGIVKREQQVLVCMELCVYFV